MRMLVGGGQDQAGKDGTFLSSNLLTLPRIDMEGQNVEASALLEKEAFMALLDDLYVTQSYRAHMHIRIVAEYGEGSRLPLSGSLVGGRVLSGAGYRYLRFLWSRHSPTLDAILMQYRDAGGASNRTRAAYAELVQSLMSLSQRWRRIMFDEAGDDDKEENDGIHQASALTEILEGWITEELITMGEYDFIENLLYTATMSDRGDDAVTSVDEQRAGSFLLAAWSNAWDILSHPDHTAADESSVISEFYDNVLLILERQMNSLTSKYTSEGTTFLQQLNASFSYSMRPASLRHLFFLLRWQQMDDEKRKNGIADNNSNNDDGEEDESHALWRHQSTLLLAAFAESADTQDVPELLDSLERIGSAWRKSSPHGALLECIDYCMHHGVLEERDGWSAELLVYNGDTAMVDAWNRYEEPGYTKQAFGRLVESMEEILERHFAQGYDFLAKTGYELVQEWSMVPDPKPRVYDDDVRNEVVGVKPSDSHPNPFPLPAPLCHTLPPTHTRILQHLLAARDPVLMAMLDEYVENGVTMELLDGITRCISRQMSARTTTMEMEMEMDGESEYAASDDGYDRPNPLDSSLPLDLETYQLCQMLASLSYDGYLHPSCVDPLLRSIIHQHPDSVALRAAFNVYKERSESDGAEATVQVHWPQMWQTVVHVANKIMGQVEMEQGDHEEAEEEEGQSLPVGSSVGRNSNSRSYSSSLYDLGNHVLDAASASEVLSVTGTLYLRDLLAQGDPTLLTILAHHQDSINSRHPPRGARDAAVSTQSALTELHESLRALSTRWERELEPHDRHTVELLRILAKYKRFSDTALDYLLGLAYARDTTLAAACSLYAEARGQERMEEAETKAKQTRAVEEGHDDEGPGGGRNDSPALLELLDTLSHMLQAGSRHASVQLAAASASALK